MSDLGSIVIKELKKDDIVAVAEFNEDLTEFIGNFDFMFNLNLYQKGHLVYLIKETDYSLKNTLK